jgi:hypothetical protein
VLERRDDGSKEFVVRLGKRSRVDQADRAKAQVSLEAVIKGDLFLGAAGALFAEAFYYAVHLSSIAHACAQSAWPSQLYPAAMTPRTDHLTAARVDLTLILLPLIGRWEAAWTLAANDVPLEVAARVMALPRQRRQEGITQQLGLAP